MSADRRSARASARTQAGRSARGQVRRGAGRPARVPAKARRGSGRSGSGRSGSGRSGTAWRGSTVSWTSLERFAARAAARRRLERRPLLYGALALAGLLGLGWLVFLSPLLAVHRVEVAGEQRVHARQVTEAAAVPLGVPMARLDIGGIQARVGAIPAVAAVDVQRRPLHTLRIVVTERTGAAAVHSPGGYQLVDDHGAIFATVAKPPRGLPVVATKLDRPSARTLQNATAVLRALPAKVRGRVVSVSADSPDDISLRLRQGVRVVWGGPEASGRKAAVLALLMRHKADVYDVSVPEAPVTRG
jgi:cell division protein FtsQ